MREFVDLPDSQRIDLVGVCAPEVILMYYYSVIFGQLIYICSGIRYCVLGNDTFLFCVFGWESAKV